MQLSVILWSKYRKKLISISPRSLCIETEKKWYLHKYNKLEMVHDIIIKSLIRKGKINIVQYILDKATVSEKTKRSACRYALELHDIESMYVLYEPSYINLFMFVVDTGNIDMVKYAIKVSPITPIVATYGITFAINKFYNNIALFMYDLYKKYIDFPVVFSSAIHSRNNDMIRHFTQDITYDSINNFITNIIMDLAYIPDTTLIKYIVNKIQLNTTEPIPAIALHEAVANACSYGNIDTAKYFVSIGGNASRIGPLVFFKSVLENRFDILEYMVNDLGKRSKSCLIEAMNAAVVENDLSTVKYIVEVLGFNGYTRNHLRSNVQKKTSDEIIEYLESNY